VRLSRKQHALDGLERPRARVAASSPMNSWSFGSSSSTQRSGATLSFNPSSRVRTLPVTLARTARMSSCSAILK